MKQLEEQREGIGMASDVLDGFSGSRAQQVAYIHEVMREMDHVPRR